MKQQTSNRNSLKNHIRFAVYHQLLLNLCRPLLSSLPFVISKAIPTTHKVEHPSTANPLNTYPCLIVKRLVNALLIMIYDIDD